MNTLNYDKLGYTPKKLYHFTLKNNVANIIKDKKLKADSFNYVYLTTNKINAIKFAIGYSLISSLDISNYVVVELLDFNIDEDKLYRSTDHNPLFFDGAKAIAHDGDLHFNDFEIYNI